MAGEFIYRSYNDVRNDVREWLKHLPEFSAVAGVPRSGVIPAAMVAMERHIPLVPIESLMASTHTRPWRFQASRQLRSLKAPVLVLDDTCWRGRTVSDLRPRVSESGGIPVQFAAVYGSDYAQEHKLLDFIGYRLPFIEHTFGWNLLKDCISSRCLLDMDGVICEDWYGGNEDLVPAQYEEFLKTVKPKCIPLQSIAGVVTARIWKFRKQTEEWLKRHGVRYGQLWLHPANDAAGRAALGPAEYKSKVYRLHAAKCFIESDMRQVRKIAEITGKAVLHYDSETLLNGHTPELISWRKA